MSSTSEVAAGNSAGIEWSGTEARPVVHGVLQLGKAIVPIWDMDGVQ
jgi:hypothetical protein